MNDDDWGTHETIVVEVIPRLLLVILVLTRVQQSNASNASFASVSSETAVGFDMMRSEGFVSPNTNEYFATSTITKLIVRSFVRCHRGGSTTGGFSQVQEGGESEF